MTGARWVVLALFAATGCVGLAHPDPTDAERAQAHFPEASLATLEAGRSAYVARCSGCHALFLPQSHSAAEWPKRVEEMEREAKLKPGERALIAQFLVTLSAREPQVRTR